MSSALDWSKFLPDGTLSEREQREIVSLLNDDPVLKRLRSPGSPSGVINELFKHQSIDKNMMSLVPLGDGKYVFNIDKSNMLIDSKYVDVKRLALIIE